MKKKKQVDSRWNKKPGLDPKQVDDSAKPDSSTEETPDNHSSAEPHEGDITDSADRNRIAGSHDESYGEHLKEINDGKGFEDQK